MRNRSFVRLLVLTLAIVAACLTVAASSRTGSTQTLSQAGVTRRMAAAAEYRETILHSFQSSPDGADPYAGLIESKGILYGTTDIGGANCQCGTVFSLAPSGANYTPLYSFSGPDGSGPFGGLIVDKAGALYGTTRVGGLSGPCAPSGCGTVFKLVQTSSGYQETFLYSFSGTFGGGNDGSAPYAALLAGNGGKLFGTTNTGGSGKCKIGPSRIGCGTVFELKPHGASYTERILYSFQGGRDGEFPQYGSSLISDASGALFGETSSGGVIPGNSLCNAPTGCGTVFELQSLGNDRYNVTVLYRFTGAADGSVPEGPLLAEGGALFGTASNGGSGRVSNGDVFKLTPSSQGYQLTVAYAFNGPPRDGGFPSSGVVAGTNGALYGTTSVGGNGPNGGSGTVFELLPSGSGYNEIVRHNFRGSSDGSMPHGSLLIAGGQIFGTTVIGGAGSPGDGGVIYKLTP